MKYFPLIFVGVIIDALQAGVSVGIAALAFAAGPLGGAAAGAALCSVAGETAAKTCGAVGGVVGAFFAGAAAGVAAPVGMALGYIISFCLGLGGGAILFVLLKYSGIFYPSRFFGGVFGEVFPGLNWLPFWTGTVVFCILKKRREEKEALAASTTTQQPLVVANDNTPPRFADIRPARIAAGVLALMFFAGGTTAYAQTLPPPIQYVVTPEAPGPNQQVTIEAQGVGSFLGSAELTWTQDGKVMLDGIGERIYTFTTGPLGQKTTVRVSIDSSQGAFAQTFVFNPSLINLVWEADTTIPPLYKGKALYSAGSDYKVVALPSVYSGGARVSPSALSFQWSRAGDALPDKSGLGRYTLALTGDQLQASEDIGVDVYYGNTLAGRRGISVPVSAPRIVLYPRDALRGALYDAAIPAAISLIGKEITVQAEPYYFSNKAKNTGALPYSWTLNGADTTGPDSSRGILTLRQTGTGVGAATVGVSVQNSIADQFVQNASASLQLVFGAQTGTTLLNFFGL